MGRLPRSLSATGGSNPAARAATAASVPANTALPAITGTLTVGQTLTASNGTWTNTPTSYALQWLRDGAPISSATGATYVLAGADSGHVISAQVTASNAVGAGQPVTAAPTSSIP